MILRRSPLNQMEEEKREHVMKMKKMEAEMEQVFEAKVKEKLQKLKDSEADVRTLLHFNSSGYYFLFAKYLYSTPSMYLLGARYAVLP